jgi:lysozyme
MGLMTMIYTLSTKGYIEIADYESLSTQCYYDSDVPPVKTLGIGLTKYDVSTIDEISWTLEFTVQQIVDMFKSALIPYIKAVNDAIKGVILTQQQFDALVSFTYNLGIGDIQKGSLINTVNSGGNSRQIRSAFMDYDHAGGKVVKGLYNRRVKEANLYTLGVYSNTTGKINHFPVDGKTHKPLYSKGILITIAEYL